MWLLKGMGSDGEPVGTDESGPEGVFPRGLYGRGWSCLSESLSLVFSCGRRGVEDSNVAEMGKIPGIREMPDWRIGC